MGKYFRSVFLGLLCKFFFFWGGTTKIKSFEKDFEDFSGFVRSFCFIFLKTIISVWLVGGFCFFVWCFDSLLVSRCLAWII